MIAVTVGHDRVHPHDVDPGAKNGKRVDRVVAGGGIVAGGRIVAGRIARRWDRVVLSRFRLGGRLLRVTNQDTGRDPTHHHDPAKWVRRKKLPLAAGHECTSLFGRPKFSASGFSMIPSARRA